MRVRILMIAAGLGVLSRPTRADPREVLVGRELAERAARRLEAPATMIVTFCEPCGELAPGAPDLVRGLAVQRRGERWAVMVGGAELELASTYVRTAPERYDNLAVLAGGAAHGASPSLRVSAATATGVLISADPSAVPPPETAPRQSGERGTLPGELTRPHPRWFLTWREGLRLLLGGAGFVAMLGAALRHRRRQLPHVPRAMALMARLPEQQGRVVSELQVPPTGRS